jgi:hypothetical protein
MFPKPALNKLFNKHSSDMPWLKNDSRERTLAICAPSSSDVLQQGSNRLTQRKRLISDHRLTCFTPLLVMPGSSFDLYSWRAGVSRPAEENKLPLSVRAVAEWEERVSAQRRLIADLKRNGEPIIGAQNKLKRYQAFLRQLCTHREIIQNLTAPDPHLRLNRHIGDQIGNAE